MSADGEAGVRHSIADREHPSDAGAGLDGREVERSIPISAEPRSNGAARGQSVRPVRHDPVVERARAAAAAVFGPPASRGFAIRYWDGSEEMPDRAGSAGGTVPFTIVLGSPAALRRAFLPPSELRLGQAYVRGDVDIEGNMEAAASLADTLRRRLAAPGTLARAMRQLLALPGDRASLQPRDRRPGLSHVGLRHSRRRDRAAVRSHYDMGNDFYALWLDRDLVYSCAYFETGVEDIDTAQAAKLDLLCRKLRLRPGERLLDIGCGWGGLIRHAARYYGVDALGITLSEQQAALARERIAAEGLGDRCRVEIRDYREFPAGVMFDKVVSVGMFEHVGRSRLGEYFRTAARLTRPGGLFLNHGIVRAREHGAGLVTLARRALWRQGAFIQRYVFPDGELVPVDVAVRCGERAGLETRDMESLREHYALTLRHWVRRLECAREAAVARVGEQAYRVWRLYMSASAYAFASGRIGLAQVLFARPDERGRVSLPPTRADIYARSTGAPAYDRAPARSA